MTDNNKFICEKCNYKTNIKYIYNYLLNLLCLIVSV